GVDIHERNKDVEEKLASIGTKVELTSCQMESMPFPDQYFDCIVSVSAVEFAQDVDRACRELRRVVAPNGTLILVTPGHSRLLDWGLKLITGESAAKDYEGRRSSVLPAVDHYFRVDARIPFPRGVGPSVRLYTALRASPSPSA